MRRGAAKRPSLPLLLTFALAASSTSAQETPATLETPPGLRYRFATGGPLLGAGALALVLPGQLAKTPPKCLWCDRDRTNFIDAWGRRARWVNDCGADALSYVTLAASAGGSLVGTYGPRQKEWATNLGTLLDSLAVSTVMVQTVKYTVRRQRPSAHSCLTPIDQGPDHDENLSFYSGHTATAFTAVFAAGTIAHQRGYKREPIIWAVGVPFAALTGYLRMAGNRHNFVDVLLGAAAGAAVGYAVPRYLHRPDPSARGLSRVAPGQAPAMSVPVQLGRSGPFASVTLSGPGPRGFTLVWSW